EPERDDHRALARDLAVNGGVVDAVTATVREVDDGVLRHHLEEVGECSVRELDVARESLDDGVHVIEAAGYFGEVEGHGREIEGYGRKECERRAASSPTASSAPSPTAA